MRGVLDNFRRREIDLEGGVEFGMTPLAHCSPEPEGHGGR